MNQKQIRIELLAIQKANSRDMLLPREVLRWARRNPKSALHAALEWDNDEAAELYRLDQIRSLIRITVVDASGEPEMVSLSIDRTAGGGYRSVRDVVDDRELSAVLLEDAVQDLDRVRQRHDRVAELTRVWRAVDKVREGMRKRKPSKKPGRSGGSARV